MSNMNVWEFVFTGGPCGGKTIGIPKIASFLRVMNYNVIVVPEIATGLILKGITPKTLGGQQEFQKRILDQQLREETFARKKAQRNQKDTVILYDRAILDNEAFTSHEWYIDQLSKRELSDEEILKHYHAVFEMITTADGAEEFYTLKNNEARSETPEEARQVERKIHAAWKRHPNFIVIDNSTDFEGKIDRVLNEILKRIA